MTSDIFYDIASRNEYGSAAAYVQLILDSGPPEQTAQQVLDSLLACEELLDDNIERNTHRATCKQCRKPIHSTSDAIGWLHDVPSGRNGIRHCRAASFDYLVGPGVNPWNNDLKRSWTAQPADILPARRSAHAHASGQQVIPDDPRPWP